MVHVAYQSTMYCRAHDATVCSVGFNASAGLGLFLVHEVFREWGPIADSASRHHHNDAAIVYTIWPEEKDIG